MNLIEVELLSNSSKLQQHYEGEFSIRYGTKPIIEDEERQIFRWLLQKVSFGTAKELLSVYILSDGDDGWFLKQAHSLKCFKHNINRIAIIASRNNKKTATPYYVVGYSVSGYPVVDKNPAALKKEFPLFKPVLFDVWIKQTVEEKLQTPKKQWEKDGNNVDLWVEHWKASGYLEKPDNSVKIN